jgi:hypothetical protein
MAPKASVWHQGVDDAPGKTPHFFKTVLRVGCERQ